MAADKLQRALYGFQHDAQAYPPVSEDETEDAADRRNAATFIRLLNGILAEEVKEWKVTRHAG